MIKWLRWGSKTRTGPDPATALKQSERRLAEAELMAADAQPTVQKAAELWRRNHLGEAAAAALQQYGSRP